MADIRQKVLVSGPWGVGKSRFALSFSTYCNEGDTISFDYERGQDHYIVDDPKRANPSAGKFYVHRLTSPTLYEAKFLIEKIRKPQASSTQLVVDGKPVDFDRIRQPALDLAKRIHNQEVKPRAIVIDTVTRLCDLLVAKVFGEAKNPEAQSMLLWAKAKDQFAEIMYEIISADLHLVMTAWSKSVFDDQARKPTKELTVDGLKPVFAFPDLVLMLQKNKGTTPAKVLPPHAIVLKSHIDTLREGMILPEATWEKILAEQPEWFEDKEIAAEARGDFVIDIE